jgi:metallo-beta-lactamase family protein
MPTLTFHGAAQQVTGSCYLLDTGASRVLLDCGLFQGPPEVDRLNERAFPFDVKSLSAVVVSHAHLDHSGLLPRLVREGYRGKIFATTPSVDLFDILWRDAAFLQERDAERQNRRRNHNHEPVEPLYTIADVEQTLPHCRGMKYDERFAVTSDVQVCFRDAGHILGAAIVEVWADNRKLVFSGDLGHNAMPLMHDPKTVCAADVLLLESTYGDRDHRPLDATLDELAHILDRAADEAGNVLIPSFAIGRTQEVLYYLGELYESGRLKQQKIFLDSPMGIAATELHQRYQQLLSEKVPGVRSRGGKGPVLPPLQYTRTTEESVAINRITGGAVIIAGSGMCTGGRIRHHLKLNLWRAEAHVVFVGFQARGTLGRALVDGAKTVKIFGEEFDVKAQVHTLGGFSAHAGQSELIQWAGGFTEQRPRTYLVHGEPDKMEALQTALKQKLGWDAKIPDPGETVRF